jgi:hypothetical protein
MPVMAVGFTPPTVPLATVASGGTVGAVRRRRRGLWPSNRAGDHHEESRHRVGVPDDRRVDSSGHGSGAVSWPPFDGRRSPYCNVISSTVVQSGGLFQAVGLFMWTPRSASAR